MFLAAGVDNVLHHWEEASAPRPGIELLIVPLAAIAAARWRIAGNRLIMLRAGFLGPCLPWMMVAALVGLSAYLGWSWSTPLTTFGPDEFGVVRWLGAALAAAFTFFWLPLIPNVTATLTGMIAGPALFAIIGYSFFGDCMLAPIPPDEGAAAALAVLIALGAAALWALGALPLLQSLRLDESQPTEGQPIYHAVWTGVVMLAFAVIGTLRYSAC